MASPRTLLPAPPIDWTGSKLNLFSRLYAELVQLGPARPFDYQAPYPKFEFFCYLVEHQSVLLHGSNNPEIGHFEPRPQTDYMGRNVTAVFATPDGIWPIFFAIIDRANYRGSLRNACVWKTDEQGVRRKKYFFSINESQLAQNPWTPGTIYVLPRQGFEPVIDFEGKPLEEWACPHEVISLGKVPVSPQDFPFLDRVEGHTDRFADLVGILLSSFSEKQALEDGYRFRYTFDPEREAQAHELLELMAVDGMEITSEVRCAPEDDSIWLSLRGIGLRETVEGILARMEGGG
jgi:hypothetical protein